jgi:hypothetical protein
VPHICYRVVVSPLSPSFSPRPREGAEEKSAGPRTGHHVLFSARHSSLLLRPVIIPRRTLPTATSTAAGLLSRPPLGAGGSHIVHSVEPLADGEPCATAATRLDQPARQGAGLGRCRRHVGRHIRLGRTPPRSGNSGYFFRYPPVHCLEAEPGPGVRLVDPKSMEEMTMALTADAVVEMVRRASIGRYGPTDSFSMCCSVPLLLVLRSTYSCLV